jgi:hypothetical protein
MTTVYLAKRNGSLCHETVGIFSSFTEANTACKEAKKEEEDDYHEFEILAVELNHRYKLSIYWAKQSEDEIPTRDFIDSPDLESK